MFGIINLKQFNMCQIVHPHTKYNNRYESTEEYDFYFIFELVGSWKFGLLTQY